MIFPIYCGTSIAQRRERNVLGDIRHCQLICYMGGNIQVLIWAYKCFRTIISELAKLLLYLFYVLCIPLVTQCVNLSKNVDPDVQ